VEKSVEEISTNIIEFTIQSIISEETIKFRPKQLSIVKFPH